MTMQAIRLTDENLPLIHKEAPYMTVAHAEHLLRYTDLGDQYFIANLTSVISGEEMKQWGRVTFGELREFFTVYPRDNKKDMNVEFVPVIRR